MTDQFGGCPQYDSMDDVMVDLAAVYRLGLEDLCKEFSEVTFQIGVAKGKPWYMMQKWELEQNYKGVSGSFILVDFDTITCECSWEFVEK